MTKHNLRSNLTWLLRQGPCLRTPLEYSTSSAHEGPAHFALHTPQEEQEDIFVTAPGRESLADRHEGIEGGDNEMARLQLPPQALPRPTLVTQSKTTSSLHDTSAYRTTVGSPSPRDEVLSTPGTRAKQYSPLPTTTTTSAQNQVHDKKRVFDLDEITFEGGDISTSSFESFGPPDLLWTEEAASRYGPVSNKNKKRKSDEYEEITHPTGSQRSTKRLFCAVSQRVTSPQAEYGSLVTVKARSPDQNQDERYRAGRPHSAKQSLQNLGYEQETNITQTTIRTETRRSKSSNRIKRRSDSDSAQPLPVNSQGSPDRSLQNAISGGIPRTVMTNCDQIAQTLSPEIKHDASPVWNVNFVPDCVEEDDIAFSISSPVKSPLKSSHMNTVVSCGGRSAQTEFVTAKRRSTPEKASACKTSKLHSSSSQLIPATPATKLTETEKLYVKKFMNIELAKCDSFLADLQKRRAKSTTEMMVLVEDDGDDDVVLEFQKKISLLNSRIKAMGNLMDMRKSFATLLQHREDVKERMQQLLEQGEELDPDKPQNELTKLYKSIKEMKPHVETKEREIYQLLQEAGLNTDTQLADSLTLKTSFESILVGATQGVPTMSGRSLHLSPRNENSLPFQRVAQTPVTSRQHPTNNRLHSTESVPGIKQPFRDMRARETIHRPERSPIQSTPRIQCKDFAFIRSEQPEFTRTMGSPSADFDIADEFDVDDADMLDAAEAFEQSRAEDGPDRKDPMNNHKVLTELSDNVRRGGSKPDMYAPSVPKAALKQYHWSKDVKEAMRKSFHLRGFRHNQLEAINATLEGKDAFVLMPTGGGKSLCYQLPSIIKSGKTRGVTIVISPLISLMQDQVQHLQNLSIQAFVVNSECTPEHRKFIFGALSDPKVEEYIQLLYVTPEMLNKSQSITNKFHELHRRNKLARIVIDEAHCVSQWGHDFRPDYKALGEWRKQFTSVPVMALTATATENVKYDVIHNLGMDGCDIFSQSFNRPNLTYTIIPKAKGAKVLGEIANTIKTRYKGQSGIVYCLSRATCEKIAASLEKDHGILAKHYHAGMESQERANVQKLWQAGKYHVIVATIAFGMGIDKPDVRYVIHHSIPKSLEGYYQETGRAGRDGKRSGCYLYYGYGDTSSLKRMINDGDGSYQQKERQKAMLRQVVQFCENQSDCRRVQVLGYFNERFDRANCKESCDNCQSDSTFETHDFTRYAQAAIRLVRRVHKDQVTLIHCADLLAGRKSKKASEHGHDHAEEFGLGSDIERGDLERVFQRLLSEDVFEEYNVMNGMGFPTAYIKLGPNYGQFENGRRPLKIQVRVKTPKGKGKPKNPEKVTGRNKASDEYLTLTNVSSPIEERSRGKLARSKRTIIDEADEDSDIDYFEPIREYGVPRRSITRELGPPIVADQKMDKLNETHRHIVDDFVDVAKKALKKIMLNKSLKRPPFSDTQLREMAIVFPQNNQELLTIDGIDEDKAARYGSLLLKHIKEAHNNYEAILRAQEEKPDDPNHENVVEISSDDENDVENYDNGFDLSQSEFEFDDDQKSQYFSAQDPDVERFNAQISQIPTFPPGSSKSANSKKQPISSRASSAGSFRGRRSFGRGGSTWRTKSKSKSQPAGGVRKQKSSKPRKSNDSATNTTSGRSGRGSGSVRSSRRGGGNGGGIGMMPT